ncbi:Oxidation resistance protein 1 [Liparis tanakae]|uniref:Oxidation resistance protein 1 n=1 Tax=Liparis tanakae TaxID=230148 RepID=A0A4Z2I4B4_9TELE|nr:Oxidation resistance protein 1 [Liparis tanakae]
MLPPLFRDSDGPPRPEGVHPPVFSALRHSRGVSSTSEEEEALTEKFLKINCKYITGGMGAVSGVLLVTPNNIMFDPHRMDPLVQAHGCEEYGIMCPLEEVQSAAICKEITEPKIREAVPDDLEPLPTERHPSQKEPEQRLKEPGADGGGGGSAAPRGVEASLSEDVFAETELSPIREEEQASSEDLRLDKSSGASAESVQTLTQVEASSPASQASGKASPPKESAVAGAEDNPPGTATESDGQSPMRSKQLSEEKPPTTTSTTSTTSTSQAQGPSSSTSRPGSQSSAPPCAADSISASASPQGEANEGTDIPKTNTMQQGKEEKETVEQMPKDGTQNSAEAPASAERRKHPSHKFLCLRVGKPMKKTFISNASASMQQYAQQGKKHEYWFAVPQERSDHLYVFFMQWSPDMYGEGVRGMGQEPGFMVVKKNEASETADDEPITDLNVKEWEITTKEEVNSKQGTSIKTELEPETFKPNLRESSDLLEAEQIEKLARNLPPRTIGYPWTLAFGTSKHGMSIKSLYRAMQGQDTPVLMVIKDSDGQVFGALASEPFKVFKWTGDNMFFMKGDMDSLAFGGGSGEFGLWLDGDLYHGRSHSCKTFGNPMLSKKEDFYVQDIEIWAFE